MKRDYDLLLNDISKPDKMIVYMSKKREGKLVYTVYEK